MEYFRMQDPELGCCLLVFQSGCVVYHYCLTYIVFIKWCQYLRFKYIFAIPPGKPSTLTIVLLQRDSYPEGYSQHTVLINLAL